MKKLILTSLVFLSFSAMANYNCSGDGVDLIIKTSNKTIELNSPYQVSIKNITESTGVYFGTVSGNKNVKTIMVDTLEGEVEIRNQQGYSKSYSVFCD